MSPKSFFESLVFTTAQHSAIRQQGEVVAGILIQLFFVSVPKNRSAAVGLARELVDASRKAA